MQVSIYMDDKLVKKADERARQQKKSRSEYLYSLVEKDIEGAEKTRRGILKCAGIFDKETADKMLKDIYSSRRSKTSWPIF